MNKPKPAFTLIECLVAMVIMALGFISIASIFPAAAFQQRRAIDDTQGVIVGHSAMATLRAAARLYSQNNPTLPWYAYFTNNGLTGASTTFTLPTSESAPSGNPYPPPLNLATPPAPVFTDPSGVYTYQVAWRQQSTTAPVEIAVFVFRAAAARAVYGATPTSPTFGFVYLPSPATIVSPTIATMNPVTINSTGLMSPSTASQTTVRPAFAAGDRNQTLLCANLTAPYDTYVVRTVTDDTVDFPPVDPSGTNTYAVYFLPQKAVAIVTGTYP